MIAQTAAITLLKSRYTFLRSHLLDGVLPFWSTHAVDPNGGLNTCIRDDGTLVSRDKYLWSQWRAVWVYSALYNLIEKRSEWLDLATHIYKFAVRYGWDEQQEGWVLGLTSNGELLNGYETVYVDAFAIYGLTQYALATKREEPLTLARNTANAVLKRLELPHDQIPHYPYPVPYGARVHGISMIFSLVFWELGQSINEQRYCDAGLALADEVMSRFYRPDRDILLERISVDGSEYPPPMGTAVVPGHVIEDMWFQIHIAKDRDDEDRIQHACRLIRRHMEVGWDYEYGGLFLAIDADGREEVGWEFADLKVWWPQTEALYSLLLAYEHTGESWCLEWYDRLHNYVFTHYPVYSHGEWRQQLDRQGNPVADTIALPVKDPFHLSRALIYAVRSLERMIQARDLYSRQLPG